MSLTPSNSLLSPSSGPQAVAMLNRLQGLLASAQSLEEITGVRSVAETARTFAKTAKLGLELQNQAAELKLRSERQAGAFLDKNFPHGGSRRSSRHDVYLKLTDAGISPQQSKRWRKLAEVPEADFQQYLAGVRKLGGEVTSAGLRRIAHALQTIDPQHRSAKDKKTPPPFDPDRDLRICAELVTELNEHRTLLHELLTPLCRSQGGLLKPAAQQHIQRLLADMERLLRELAKTVC